MLPSARRMAELEAEVRAGGRTPALAVDEIVSLMRAQATRRRGRLGVSASLIAGAGAAPDAEPQGRTTVLITGFGPFPGVPVNATMRLLPELARARRAALSRRALRRRGAADRMGGRRRGASSGCWPRSQPDLALHFGVSSRARGFEIEQRAQQRLLGRAGCRRRCCPSRAAVARRRAPSTCAASLPVQHIVARLRRRGIPAFASRDAGAYLCNAALYHSLVCAQRRAGPPRRLRAHPGHPRPPRRAQPRPHGGLPADLGAGAGRRPGDSGRVPWTGAL